MKMYSNWLLVLSKMMEMLEDFLGLMLLKSSFDHLLGYFGLDDDDESDDDGAAGCRRGLEHRFDESAETCVRLLGST